MQNILQPDLDALRAPTKPTPPPAYKDPRTSLFYLAIASLTLLLLVPLISFVWTRTRAYIAQRKLKPAPSPSLSLLDGEDEPLLTTATVIPAKPRILQPHEGDFSSALKKHVDSLGGRTIFAFNLLRFLGCFALLGLTIAAVVVDSERSTSTEPAKSSLMEVLKKKKNKGRKGRERSEAFGREEVVEIFQAAFFVYTTFLALLTLTVRRARFINRTVKPHLVTLLLVAFALYSYRNLLPLTTLHGHPKDIAFSHLGKKGRGWASLVWWRIGLLGFTSIVIPLLVPRLYEPVDPQNPSPNPPPEQTASILSRILFAYITPLVVHAWKLPALPYEGIPAMADFDASLHLAEKHMSSLDPLLMPQGPDPSAVKKRSRHVVFGLIKAFYVEGLSMTVLLLIKLVFDFTRPLAIQQLLAHIEDPSSSDVRPIVWVAALFIGPLFGSLSIQLYQMVSARILVRSEALLSQLILNHSLRIRFVGKPQSGSATPSAKTSGATTPAAVPASGATIEEDAEVGQDAAAAGPDPKIDSKAGDMVGKINNLIGSDLQAIAQARDILVALFFSPLQTIFAVAFLYRLLSWSAFVGTAAMFATLPLPTLVLKKVSQVSQELAIATDTRIQAVTEAMNSIRVVKMLAWEAKVEERIAHAREKELHLIRKKNLLAVLNNSINFIVSAVCMISTFVSYTVLQKQVMSSSKIFSTLATFEIMRWAIHVLFWESGQAVRGKVSLDRLNSFLQDSEVIDELDQQQILLPPSESSFIGFTNATFAWLREDKVDITVRNFRLHLDVSFVPGELNIISGQTGSGKSSVLAALLGEMHFEPSSFDSSFNLPRAGGVAYVPQEPWLLNASIRDNILLNQAFDATRFAKVIEACALTRDLELLSGGDQTEVGEKGITLSGGQKARINLARAVYSNAQVLLMDDVLSALDAHTSKHIVEKCLSSDLVKGRTVILATHHVSLVAPVASFILSLSKNGKVESQGPVDKVIKEDAALKKAIAAEEKDVAAIIQEADGSEKTTPTPRKADVLVQEEEKAEGRTSWRSFRAFIDGMGWRPIIIFIAAIFTQEVADTTSYWLLGQWGNQYEKRDSAEVSIAFWLGCYIALALAAITIYSSGQVVFFFAAVDGSRSLHKKLTASILNSTFRWLDATPVGRTISRFSKDFASVDGLFTIFFSHMVEVSSILLVKLTGVVIYVPIFSIPSLFLGLVGAGLAELYIHCQLSVKREMSNQKTPLFNHLNSAIGGVVSIRAYGIQDWIAENTQVKVDKWTRSAITFYALDRWITNCIDVLAGLFTASLAAYLVYSSSSIASGNVGFILNVSVSFSSHILWWVRIGNMWTIEANSLERIVDYLHIPHEKPFKASALPPAFWPSSGGIVVENLTARYSEGAPAVLNDLSFTLKSGEKIGVVGRTGAGKSSMALAMLRMIPTEGKVVIDGIDSSKLNLSTLRSTITIIPQDPVLLSGSLRYNLDPEGSMDDATLNDALNASGLSSLQAGSDASSAQTITLDTELASGGSNLSQGQRQVLVLARALVRRSPIILMDEATSSIDHQTDEAIQRGIRNELQGVTVITIAHRLRSIADYDRVMCLAEGKIVAFDTPKALLSDPDSYFSMLVKSSGEEEVLRKMILG